MDINLPSDQGPFSHERNKRRAAGELEEQSFSQQPQPHHQCLQGDLQWDEEDMTNFQVT